MFYDRFLELCQRKNVSPSSVVKAIGLATPNATYWKKGSIPNATTIMKLCKYFNVTPAYLMGNDFAEGPLDIEPEGDLLSQVSFALFGEHNLLDEELLEDVKSYAKFKLEQRKEKK